MRMHAKHCVGVAFVLDQLSEATLPKRREDVPDYIRKGTQQSKKKGLAPGQVDLPQHVWNLMVELPTASSGQAQPE